MDCNLERRDHWERQFGTLLPHGVEQPPERPLADCIDFFKGRNVELVLDIGSGSGRWAIPLARQGFLVEGFDFSESAVRFARAWATRERVLADFECASVTEFPFPGEIFDAALATLVLDVLSPREMAMTIDQMAERVRRGGVAFALFHPFTAPEPGASPTAELAWRPYRDNDLKRLFPGFALLEFRSYSGGLRGLFLKRN